MNLTPEQKAAVASWVTAGDNLSVVQKKLAEQFKLSLTYRDVRFLVDDLDLTLKDAAPKVDASDVTKAAPPPKPAAEKSAEKKGFFDKAKEKLGLAKDEVPEEAAADAEAEFADDLPPAGASTVSVAVDKATLIPGAIASGSVTFSDGVTGQWVVDQYGRPGFTKISQAGYRPTPEDAQSFMQELSRALQQRGY
ncbi:MAG: hypothetical protein HZA93_28105 [Verrucomicrobia bacterium]|nr:hypothetical protein [Verrucomicrobiota bacterium]